jgi:hypothetical protein
MSQRRISVWIAVVGGLALVVGLLYANSAVANPAPPETLPRPARAVQAGGMWTSGWAPINPGQTLSFNHNLGGDPNDYVVELMFLDTDAGGLGINRRNYGGMEVSGDWSGAHWQNLTANSIEVYRQPDDGVADRIRVSVGVAPSAPDYDSGWLDINPGQTMTISHNLGITATDLTVSLWFSGTVRGIHQFGYGGLAVDGPHKMLGAHWQNLTDNTVQVIRHPDDTDVEQVRVVVVHGDPPAYDSLQALGGWQNVAAGTPFVFNHNLHWNPTMLLVRGECYDPSGLRGIHQLFAGGNHDWFGGGHFQGANIQNLTDDAVAAFRWAQDEFCPEVRVRIWKRSIKVYLPLVLNNH